MESFSLIKEGSKLINIRSTYNYRESGVMRYHLTFVKDKKQYMISCDLDTYAYLYKSGLIHYNGIIENESFMYTNKYAKEIRELEEKIQELREKSIEVQVQLAKVNF